jgi:hypothetical protein
MQPVMVEKCITERSLVLMTYNTYEVWKHTSPDIKQRIVAKTNNQAKRIYCKRKGISPSDAWCGLSNIVARKVRD